MKKRVSALLLAAILLVTALLPAFLGVSAQETKREAHYTKSKVISVLFDNSASMTRLDKNTPVYRWEYARYALQTLISTLTAQDTLIITPMNKPNGMTVTDTAYSVTVNLAAKDRDAEIDRVLNETFLGTAPESGGTPHEPIDIAIQHLVDRGMKTTDEIAADETSSNDYFLMVLTDGEFRDCSGLKEEQQKIDLAASYFSEDLEKYAFFQSIYIGFDTDALDLNRAPALADKTNFKAYKAPDTAAIGGVMRDVIDRITGRYSLDVSVEPDATSLRISLDSVKVALRSVTVMATNTHARFDGVTYGGEKVTASQKAQFEGFTAKNNPQIHMEGGFSAMLTLGAENFFMGGELVVSLTEALGADAVVSVQLEPALTLIPVVRATPDGEEIDSAYVNSRLSAGDNVYVSYRLVEKGSDRVVEAADVGGAAVGISYDGRSYAPNAAIPLVAGKKEIGISVSMMNGQYTLYTSFPCVVLTNPAYFRIEAGNVTARSETVFEVPFTVFENNLPLASLAALEKHSPSVTARGADGGILPVTLSKKADGTFTATLDVTGLDYGTYTLFAGVRSEDGNVRSAELPIGYYPSGLVLTAIGGDRIEKTLHGLQSNTDSFAFALTAQDKEIPFRNALLSYTLTVGGVDVTAAAVLDGNRLSYTPTPDTLGALASTVGIHDVCLTVTLYSTAPETVMAQAQLSLAKTLYEISPLAPTGQVDRFDLKENQSALYFRVLRDGVSLTAEELTAALANGEITLDEVYRTFLTPVRTETSVEMKDGAPAVRVGFTGGHLAPVRGLFTSMFVLGDGLTVGLAYQDASAEGCMPLAPVNFLSYVWRVLLILYLFQLVFVAVTFSAVKRVPRGTLIALLLTNPVSADGGITSGESEIKRIEIKHTVTLLETLQPFRLIPFVGLFFWHRDVRVDGDGLTVYMEGSQECVTFVTGTNVQGTLEALPPLFAWITKIKNGGKPAPVMVGAPILAGSTIKWQKMMLAHKKKLPLKNLTGVIRNNTKLYLFLPHQ